MPSKDFTDKILRVLRKEAQRIAALDDPIEKEFEAREFQRMLMPHLVTLRQLRTDAIGQVLSEDETMSLRDLSLVMGLSHTQLKRLKDGSEFDPEELAG
jgi:hypothetical protein